MAFLLKYDFPQPTFSCCTIKTNPYVLCFIAVLSDYQKWNIKSSKISYIFDRKTCYRFLHDHMVDLKNICGLFYYHHLMASFFHSRANCFSRGCEFMVMSQDFCTESQLIWYEHVKQISGGCPLGAYGDKHHTIAEHSWFHLAWGTDWCEAQRAWQMRPRH